MNYKLMSSILKLSLLDLSRCSQCKNIINTEASFSYACEFFSLLPLNSKSQQSNAVTDGELFMIVTKNCL